LGRVIIDHQRDVANPRIEPPIALEKALPEFFIFA
jgi:hypothetical protein